MGATSPRDIGLTLLKEANSAGDGPSLWGLIEKIQRTLADHDYSQCPEVCVGLHYYAARALLRVNVERSVERLAPILAHADAGIAWLARIDLAQLRSEFLHLRAEAYIQVSRGLTGKQLGDALHACADALADPEIQGDPRRCGPLGYNAGMFVIRGEGFPEDEDALRRLEVLFTTAHDSYRVTGAVQQAADASLYLSQIGLSRLRAAQEPLDQAERTFDAAWRQINEFMAAYDPLADPDAWANANLVAASLAELRPSAGSIERARDSAIYLDRAFDTFQQLRNEDGMFDCACRLIRAIDLLPRGYNEGAAVRYDFYMDVLDAARERSRDMSAGAQTQLLRANAWMKVERGLSPEKDAEVLSRVRSYARAAALLAFESGKHELSSVAYKLVGVSLTGDTRFSHLNQQSPAPETDQKSLAEACEAFERSIAEARAAKNTELAESAIRMLAVALGRRLRDFHEFDLFDRSIALLEEAIEFSSGEPYVTANANLVSMTILAAHHGLDVSLGRARKALDCALRELNVLESVALSEYVKSLEAALDELEFLGRDGVANIAQRVQAQISANLGIVRLERAYFKRFRHDVLQLPDKAKPIDVVSLLLMPETDDRSTGTMRLETEGASTFGIADIACPRCQAMLEITLPVVIHEDADSPRFANFKRNIRGDESCTSCRFPFQVQSIFILLKRSVSGEPIAIYPDVLVDRGERLITHQQFAIAGLHQAITGQRLMNLTFIPWAGCVNFDFTVDETLRFQRKAALTLLASGIVAKSAPIMLEALRMILRWRDADAPASSEIEAALNELPLEFEALQRRRLPRLIVRLVKTASLHGPEWAIDQIATNMSRVQHIARAYASSSELARDPVERRTFLAHFISELADYSPDRAIALFDMLMREPSRELRKLEDEGVPELDSVRYQLALARINGMRPSAEDMIARDKITCSSSGAKALIANRLAGKAQFTLILRAFSMDVAIHEMPESFHGVVDASEDPRVKWRMFSLDPKETHLVDKACTVLPQDINPLTVLNVLDPKPPTLPTKLFVTDVEWRRVAFSLIAEAAVVILLLPAGSTLGNAGVDHEIQVIREMSRQDDTIAIIMRQPKDVRSPFVASSAQTEPVNDTAAELRDLGFQHIFDDEAFGIEASSLRSRVRTLFDSK
ncbi:hypothetical protein [Paraburkholderia tuberum]|uniref:Uncharacterized protein n=1 Tax=Paraburkholderia tuberum TaxID=157910 RepID=A0A1H1KHK9_9BURK|nr:hypothetical protein [Paraburkholderia tuberum]SDR61726.1 hypothetical protein SAMN05445850_7925 [Paraburkholderia tuberum]